MSLKHVLTTAALCTTLVAPVFAQEAASKSPHNFTPNEVKVLFDTPSEMPELASLSAEEMTKTEGALVPNVAGAVGGLVGYGFSCGISGSCTPYGAAFAAGVGAINPIYGVWGFNSAVGVGIAEGVGSAYKLW